MNNPQTVMDALVSGLKAMSIKTSLSQRQQLLDHIALLKKWNRQLNLTAITSDQGMIANHILDSLAILPYIKGTRVLDIGSGGGFPGLPLAIANPLLVVTLIDSRSKKIAFLRQVVATLGLENVIIENSRIENYQPAQKFDTLTARAFSSLSDLIRLCTTCITGQTRLLAMKGKHPVDEINALNDETKARVKVAKLEIPQVNADRHLVILDY